MATNSSSIHRLLASDSAAARRHRRLRKLKDLLARYLVVAGGFLVIGALLLIFAYLFYVVLPLFQPASVEPVARYPVPAAASGQTVGLALQEHNELAARFSSDGNITFLNASTGEIVQQERLPVPAGVSVTSFAEAYPNDRVVAYGLSDGRALLVRYNFTISFDGSQRRITPELEYPLEAEPLVVDQGGQPLTALAVQLNEDGASLVGRTAAGQLSMAYYSREESFLTGEVEWSHQAVDLPQPKGEVSHLLLSPEQNNLFVIENGQDLKFIDVGSKDSAELIQRLKLVEGQERITAAEFLAGGSSLLIGSSSGRIAQWFPVRDERNEWALTQVRSWDDQDAAITVIAPEQNRKGFFAADATGKVGIYHSTAHRTLEVVELADAAILDLTVGPRANALLAQTEQGLQLARVENAHPEVSWSALWGKVWYEGYDQPYHIWQSSAATSDFEPKFSLTPLVFGTLKAAFYAMLFAIPLGVMAAIYTAYFMAPRMRQIVKPVVEIMAALPTVILGFLAGLWLAPNLEDFLPGFVALLVVLPLGVLLCSYLWSRLPAPARGLVPPGWEAALLIPVVLGLGALSFGLSPVFEDAFFDGNIRSWLINTMGIEFDQRNALVVGIAMGIAVIPIIFSIAEDAIFSVPKHLTFGALALGSTPWQALTRVVLLTASPGIFSAVMIGLGRAVGETMIVLMATGNTPIMDWSIFEGMRTLAANVAVEMPETEVDSTHYRVLFLSGLVLFMLTFVFNTAAEVVRQRLRAKYSSL